MSGLPFVIELPIDPLEPITRRGTAFAPATRLFDVPDGNTPSDSRAPRGAPRRGHPSPDRSGDVAPLGAPRSNAHARARRGDVVLALLVAPPARRRRGLRRRAPRAPRLVARRADPRDDAFRRAERPHRRARARLGVERRG